ncbi:MAG: RidA family protein [Acidimicrobiia bacterium]|nr:RidA family protein [Acidimicrobiia bacterium]NNF10577.1 RidA family protein [Acidimicrobiia bacterium]NNL70726.1 RidA family protein [Acidimicrobiia bacterium]
MTTQRVWSGSPWEDAAGYCRAVRVGNHIWVAGTAPFLDDGSVASPGDLAAQAERCLTIIDDALAALGSGAADVVLTRMYVTDITRAGEVSDAHRTRFGAHPPVSTLIEVATLVHPDVLIEIEVEALVRDG